MEAVRDRTPAACLLLFLYTDSIPHRYCAEMKVGEWKATLENLDCGMTQDFLLYIYERYKIKS